MTNRRILLAAIVAGLVTYGGLVGGEAVLTGGLEGPADEAIVSGTTTHLDRSGRPVAVGEVTNRFGGPITNVSVTVEFYRDGDLVAEQTGSTLQGTIPAGASVPFDIRMQEEGDRVDRVETSVSFDRGGEVVDGLVVTDKRVVRESQDQVDVAVTVTNRADQPLVLRRAVATFYDDRRSVIGARTEQPARRIAPGESTTVRLRFRTLGNVPSYAREFERFDVSVVAEAAE